MRRSPVILAPTTMRSIRFSTVFVVTVDVTRRLSIRSEASEGVIVHAQSCAPGKQRPRFAFRGYVNSCSIATGKLLRLLGRDQEWLWLGTVRRDAIRHVDRFFVSREFAQNARARAEAGERRCPRDTWPSLAVTLFSNPRTARLPVTHCEAAPPVSVRNEVERTGRPTKKT